jgi:hypothetical protein
MMGSIQVDSVHNQTHSQKDASFTAQTDEDGFRSFKIMGLSASPDISPTGLREEILLLAWLIVLLRSSDGGSISCSWVYNTPANGSDQEPILSLSMDEVLTGSGLKNLVGRTAAAIADRIVASRQHAIAVSGPVSITLSNSSQVQKTEESKNEVSRQRIL